MAKTYPAASVSRTLDPSGRAFTTVIGKHDRRLTDADINLMQDIQALKDQKRVDNQIFSGALTYTPFVFNPTKENTFKIPAFDVMFSGEVVTIGGSFSADPTFNSVTLPAPSQLGAIDGEEASLYIVYLEMWYAVLDPASGAGYLANGNQLYIYPNGCLDADVSNLISDDVIDPFQGLNTTSRGQIQWAIRVAPISLFYDFEKYRYGLDPGANLAKETLFGQAFLDAPPDTSSLTFAFQNMGGVNGDFGLWRAGDGSVVPTIPTMDGYTYALPLAAVFQRNTGMFDPAQNPFGCGANVADPSGQLSTVSGRYDRKFADAIYDSDVVDTRMTVSLAGYDWNRLLNTGFTDLVNGGTRLKVARGETPGNRPTALASRPSYTVSVGPTAVANTDSLGPFDGLMNGFSTDDRTFFTTKTKSIADKVVGTSGARWAKGDVVEIDISNFAATTAPIISSVVVQGLATLTDGSGALNPVILLSGQVVVTGTGSRKVQIKIAQDLQGTGYDPGIQDLYFTIGVRYGVQSLLTTGKSGYSTVKIPAAIDGGRLFDYDTLKTYAVFGVSDFTTTKKSTAKDMTLISYNPQYSNKVFGTRAEIVVDAALGVAALNGLSTAFTLNVNDLGAQYDGLYAVKASNLATATAYTVLSNEISADGATLVVTLSGLVPDESLVCLTVILRDTAQMGFNAPVKAITSIEETILIGSAAEFSQMDGRVRVVSQRVVDGYYIVVIAARDGRLSGISGDDANKQLFISVDNGGVISYVSHPISNAQFFNAFVTLSIPVTANGRSIDLTTSTFFMVGAFAPALNPLSTLAFSFDYIPYQGEGKIGRDYSFIHSEDTAYVTTNGTGAAPVVGLKDVYPYNRELPIVSILPSQMTWSDADLGNQSAATYFGSNYDAKKFSNIEHTFATPLRTNDFIEPVGGWKRKKLRLSTPSGRGFAKAFPHVGFAINPPIPKATQSSPVTTTSADTYLYVNNATGNDSYDGLSSLSPKRTITGALNSLPSVLRHPCYVFILATAIPFKLADLRGSLEVAKLGDGEVNQINRYCLDNLGFAIQDAGRLYIGREPSATDRIVIDATGFRAFGDGPTSAFVITNSRVVLNGLEFKGFRDAAIYAQSSYVEMVDCLFTGNLVSGSFSNGCNVTASRCTLEQNAASTGFVVSNSDLLSSACSLKALDARVNAFYVAERSASITLLKHSNTEESNLNREEWVINRFETKYETVAVAKLSSSLICGQGFTSSGAAKLTSNSVMVKPPTGAVFAGDVTLDASSTISTDIS